MKLFEFLWVRNGKICHFWAELVHWYRYRKYRAELVPVPKVGVPVPIHQRGIGTGTEIGGIGTRASSNPIFVPLHC